MFLLTTDIHLSDKPKDGYRFGLFPWLLEQQKKFKVDATFLLGDTTEHKDRHSAELVNKTVESLMMLKPPVYILKGNHDYINENLPYFEFLNAIDGINFISSIEELQEYKILMIPHQPNQAAFGEFCQFIRPHHTVMLHQTLSGAIAETGAPLTGLSWPLSGSRQPKAVYSGDVHKPQQSGCVTYIGAPFHVRFGDEYTPRVLLLDHKGGETNLYFPAPKKAVLRIRDADEIPTYGLVEKDQVKIIMELAREEVVEWASHKQRIIDTCSKLGLDVYGVELKVASNKRQRIKVDAPTGKTNHEHFKTFCAAESVPAQMKAVGAKLIGG